MATQPLAPCHLASLSPHFLATATAALLFIKEVERKSEWDVRRQDLKAIQF